MAYRIAVQKNIRYGQDRLEFFTDYVDESGAEYYLEITLKPKDHNLMEIANKTFIKKEDAQLLMDDLYHVGIRPNIKNKDMDLIKHLEMEIEKRDNVIVKLMDQFVFKDEQCKINRKLTV